MLCPAIVGTKPTSLALKSMVRALAPVSTTVIRPLPLIQYCHSLTFGCQCISRMPPGLIVTMAEAIFCATGKLLESMMRTSPPAVFFVGAMDDALKVYLL